jgi:archaellum component FlaC
MKNKIMTQIGDDLEKFRDNSNNQKDKSQELLNRTEHVKQLIEEYDELTEKLHEIGQIYDVKSKELFNTDKVKHTRNALAKLKKQVFKMNVELEIVRGHLLTEQVKEGGDAFSMYKNVDKIASLHNDKEDSFDI